MKKYGYTARVLCHLINLICEKKNSFEETEEDGTLGSVQVLEKENVCMNSQQMTDTQDVVDEGIEVDKLGGSEEEDLGSVIFDLSKVPLFHGDAYYGSVCTAIAVHVKCNVHFLGVVKQFCANYPKEDIVSALEGKATCTKIVLTTTVKGVRLVEIRYNQK